MNVIGSVRGKAPVEAIEAMLDRHVLLEVGGDLRFCDIYTGALLTTREFNRANTSVAPHGSRGVRAAAAIYINHPHCRHVRTLTAQPGPLIVTLKTGRTALNTVAMRALHEDVADEEIEAMVQRLVYVDDRERYYEAIWEGGFHFPSAGYRVFAYHDGLRISTDAFWRHPRARRVATSCGSYRKPLITTVTKRGVQKTALNFCGARYPDWCQNVWDFMGGCSRSGYR
jgi:hypothetical protein